MSSAGFDARQCRQTRRGRPAPCRLSYLPMWSRLHLPAVRPPMPCSGTCRTCGTPGAGTVRAARQRWGPDSRGRWSGWPRPAPAKRPPTAVLRERSGRGIARVNLRVVGARRPVPPWLELPTAAQHDRLSGLAKSKGLHSSCACNPGVLSRCAAWCLLAIQWL